MRADRAKGVERLPPHPLAVGELEVPRGHVVETEVAGHRLERGLDRSTADAFADDDAELRLVVDLVRHGRDHDRLAGPDQGIRPLREQQRRGGQLRPLFLRMVAVVQADADDLLGPIDGESHAARR